MISPVAQGLVTVEELARLPGSKQQELVRGQVIEVVPPGGRHREVAGALITLLRLRIKQWAGGYAGVEAGKWGNGKGIDRRIYDTNQEEQTIVRSAS